ncbi:outer membrane protein assembly factor BamD [Thermovibrio ammonificans]|uniref:Outer membrane assembly lipoprotein YfiO n=1 Tax=Thermovibrio ammonificans (strain DSM 15698 / JCM 12110 / HB-1) TaxID=648996 RepID=E8T3G5_THEA1|nr:outer membrane protein assembly factor BamD [Thermovibrio ammonificans]ADU96096.1 outer membrane assembly lipoprotein YfiO [Thermovibrio ammonificans HB-1]
MKKQLALAAAALMVAACAKVPRTAEGQYREGIKAAAQEDWGRTIFLLKKALQGNLPPKEQEFAKIALADAYFNEGDYENAALNYEEFLQLYPASPRAKDALFRLGVCYLNLVKGPQWDVTFAKRAYNIFQRFIKEYPNDPRVKKAKLYAELARKILAEHEIYIGGTYDMLRKFTASIQRYTDVERKFKDVEAPDRLLYLLGRAYYYTPLQAKEEIERLKEESRKDRERLKSKEPDEVRVARYRLKLEKEEIEKWKSLAEKNRKKGRELLEQLIKRYPNSPYARKAQEILNGHRHLEVEPVENPIKHSIWWKIKETL